MDKISHVDFFKEGMYETEIWIDGESNNFEFYFGSYSEEAAQIGELQETGVFFSGINGYLFDQSGVFFGGYSPHKNLKLKIIKEDYYNFSYFLNDDLIYDDRTFNVFEINAIKFSAEDKSRLSGKSYSPELGNVAAGTFGEILEDNLDNSLNSSDNILLISHL